MKNFIFDINRVEFEECYHEEYETMTLYFIAPKEWLGDAYPEAIHAEISLECRSCSSSLSVDWGTVMMSPTRKDEAGNEEDYDWFDIDLSYSDIEALLNLYLSNARGA